MVSMHSNGRKFANVISFPKKVYTINGMKYRYVNHHQYDYFGRKMYDFLRLLLIKFFEISNATVVLLNKLPALVSVPHNTLVCPVDNSTSLSPTQPSHIFPDTLCLSKWRDKNTNPGSVHVLARDLLRSVPTNKRNYFLPWPKRFTKRNWSKNRVLKTSPGIRWKKILETKGSLLI